MNKVFQSLVFVALLACVFAQITIPLQSTQRTKLPSRMLDSSSESLSLTNELNYQFVGPIQIGTPAQTFQVIFDSYYADTVVFSPTCENCDATFNTYNASASKTHFDEQKEETFGFYAVNNGAMCQVYSDVVNVAGHNLSDVEFLVIESFAVNSTKENQKYDGYFGMGYLTNLTYNVTPFAQLMDQQNLSKISSFYYTNAVGQAGSSVTLGGYNTSLDSNITYHNVSVNNTWQLKLDDFGYGNQSYSNGATDLQVVLGTGLPVITGSSQLVDNLLAKFQAVDNCYNTDYLSNLYFTIGGIRYEVPPTIFYLHDQEDSVCSLLLMDNSTYPYNVSAETIFLGIPFIQTYYTILDVENQRVGFAPNSLPSPTPKPNPLGAFRLNAVSGFVSLFLFIVYVIA